MFHVAVGKFIKIFCFVFPVCYHNSKKMGGFLALGEVYTVEQEADVPPEKLLPGFWVLESEFISKGLSQGGEK